MNASELRAKINAAKDSQTEAVAIPEWDVVVYMRSLTAKERGTYEAEMLRIDGKGKQRVNESSIANVRERLVARCMVDEAGERVFSDTAISELGAKDSGVLLRLFEIAQRLNGMTQADIEALEKNSGSNRDDDSYSTWQDISVAPSPNSNHASPVTNSANGLHTPV